MAASRLLDVKSQEPLFTESTFGHIPGLKVGGILGNPTLQYAGKALWRAGLQVRRAAVRVAGRRDAELRWRRAHRQTLRAYLGQWVVLEGQQIVAFGPSLADVVIRAREAGVAVPYVFRVEDFDEGSATLGL